MAITGGGIDKRPALEEADVGISMYFCGTEFSQEGSNIVMLDDDLVSVTDLLRCLRCLYLNVQNLVRLQLTFIISVLSLNFICIIVKGFMTLAEVHLLEVRMVIFILDHTTLVAEKPTNYISPMPPP